MADISTITLPDGNSYNFRDTRAAIATSTTTGTVKPDNSTITVDANGVISASGGGGASITTAAVTLAVADWSSNTQTVSVTGVTASNSVIVTYAPSSKGAYTAADIYCSAQGAGTLTFSCTTTPTVAVDVNVMIIE